MAKNILFRTVIEILGKPQEHVDKSLKNFVIKLKEDQDYEVITEDYAELKKQDESELWAGFAEMEVKTDKVDHLIKFCFDYMPSIIEVIEPKELKFSDMDVSHFLNDLQARLHQVDMVAKQVKFENDQLKKTTSGLLKNYLFVLLSKSNLSSEQLSKLTGVNKEKLEDFLDSLIDDGKVGLKEGIYFAKKEEGKN